MRLRKDEYQCTVCGEVWTIIPEDWGSRKDYPTVCSLCSMPVMQMLSEVIRIDGPVRAIQMLGYRLKAAK